MPKFYNIYVRRQPVANDRCQRESVNHHSVICCHGAGIYGDSLVIIGHCYNGRITMITQLHYMSSYIIKFTRQIFHLIYHPDGQYVYIMRSDRELSGNFRHLSSTRKWETYITIQLNLHS